MSDDHYNTTPPVWSEYLDFFYKSIDAGRLRLYVEEEHDAK